MKKSTAIFILALLTSFNGLTAQTTNCHWAQSIGSSSDELGRSVSTDAGGNVFMTGYFASPTIVFGTTMLTNAGTGSYDIYIVKYSPNGTVLWAKSAGGTQHDLGMSVCTDTSGNIYLAGSFHSPTLSFGTTTLSNFSSGFTSDIFIAKYSPTGTLLWAKSAGGNRDDEGRSLSTDASGNVFLTGDFTSSSITFGTTTLLNASASITDGDAYIVKYSPSGNVLWANSAGGSFPEYGYSVSTDAGGNVFMSGWFQSPSITFGTITLTHTTVSSNFIVKYSPTGTPLWANSSDGHYSINSVSSDVSGNAFLIGSFSDYSVTIGTNTLTNAAATSTSSDIFIAKYSPSGTVLWAKSIGGIGNEMGRGVSTDANGNVFLIGDFKSSSLTIGTYSLSNVSTNNPGNNSDILLVKYSSSGTVLWASSSGGAAYDVSYCVSNDASGNVFMTGYFTSPNMTIGACTIAGYYDIYIAKLGSDLLGISENQTKAIELNIYPNPFSSQTTISFSEVQTNTTIKIMDLLGNEIRTIPVFHEQQIVLEKGTLDLGIYFVQIIDENNTVINKKIVLR